MDNVKEEWTQTGIECELMRHPVTGAPNCNACIIPKIVETVSIGTCCQVQANERLKVKGKPMKESTAWYKYERTRKPGKESNAYHSGFAHWLFKSYQEGDDIPDNRTLSELSGFNAKFIGNLITRFKATGSVGHYYKIGKGKTPRLQRTLKNPQIYFDAHGGNLNGTDS